MSDAPPGGAVAEVRTEARPPTPPGGPDWTRGVDASRPDEQQVTMVEAAIIGRLRGKLASAMLLETEVERMRALEALILRLIRNALTEADPRTILDGLL